MITISQAEVNMALANKLGSEDINASSNFCRKGAARNRLTLEIITRLHCHCPEKDGVLYTLPEGNINADIMFIGDIPSEWDGQTHTTFFDASGRLITVVLDKLGLKRDNIYVSNATKCCIKNGDAQEIAYICASRFILREIDLVRPKMIITLGVLPANIIRSMVMNLPEVEDVSSVRNTLFPVQIGEHNCKVAHTISPSFVLSKNGAMYTKYKTDLWNDIKGAYTHLNT